MEIQLIIFDKKNKGKILKLNSYLSQKLGISKLHAKLYS
jgi:hypothetical protein